MSDSDETKKDPQHFNPNAESRRSGYTRNPENCGHTRLRFVIETGKYRCLDCGELK